jgi:hypothetical protein
MNGVRKVNVWSESGKGRVELQLDKIREDTGKRADEVVRGDDIRERRMYIHARGCKREKEMTKRG